MQGRIKGGEQFGQVPGGPRFRGRRRFLGPRGFLGLHVFRDHVLGGISHMHRGADASRFNMKYDS